MGVMGSRDKSRGVNGGKKIDIRRRKVVWEEKREVTKRSNVGNGVHGCSSGYI